MFLYDLDIRICQKTELPIYEQYTDLHTMMQKMLQINIIMKSELCQMGFVDKELEKNRVSQSWQL